MIRLIKCLALCITIGANCNLYADSTNRDLAVEYLKLSKAKETIDSTIEIYVEQISAQNPKTNKQQIYDHFNSLMGWDKLEEPTINIVMNNFLTSELKAINEFYKSDLGEIFAQKSLVIAVELSNLISKNIKTPSASQTEADRSLSIALTNAVIEINANAPKVLDEETRLDSAATFKNYMIYNNTMVNYSAEQLDVTLFVPIVEKAVIDQLCVNTGLASFIDLGVVMVYRYHGKNGQFITELSKDMASCNNT